MQTHISKWGNSLALRIPAALVEKLALSEGAAVELHDTDGVLTVSPCVKRYPLSELLEGITAENMHHAIDEGDPLGNEAIDP